MWLLALAVKSCRTLCNPMHCSTPGFPALCHLLELAQTHVHWVYDAISHHMSLWWELNHLILCHPVLFSPCHQSFTASRSFPMNYFFASRATVNTSLWDFFWSSLYNFLLLLLFLAFLDDRNCLLKKSLKDLQNIHNSGSLRY